MALKIVSKIFKTKTGVNIRLNISYESFKRYTLKVGDCIEFVGKGKIVGISSSGLVLYYMQEGTDYVYPIPEHLLYKVKKCD